MHGILGLTCRPWVLAFVVLGGWLLWRSVTVESTPDKIEITLDKHELMAAGRQAAAKGREAVGEAGKLFVRGGQALERSHENNTGQNHQQRAPQVPFSETGR